MKYLALFVALGVFTAVSARRGGGGGGRFRQGNTGGGRFRQGGPGDYDDGDSDYSDSSEEDYYGGGGGGPPQRQGRGRGGQRNEACHAQKQCVMDTVARDYGFADSEAMKDGLGQCRSQMQTCMQEAMGGFAQGGFSQQQQNRQGGRSWRGKRQTECASNALGMDIATAMQQCVEAQGVDINEASFSPRNNNNNFNNGRRRGKRGAGRHGGGGTKKFMMLAYADQACPGSYGQLADCIRQSGADPNRINPQSVFQSVCGAKQQCDDGSCQRPDNGNGNGGNGGGNGNTGGNGQQGFQQAVCLCTSQITQQVLANDPNCQIPPAPAFCNSRRGKRSPGMGLDEMCASGSPPTFEEILEKMQSRGGGRGGRGGQGGGQRNGGGQRWGGNSGRFNGGGRRG